MRRMYSKPQLLEAVEQEAEVNGLKAFENIVDKDGHKRFIESDLELPTISGITYTYSKWSLSGTHLLLVLGFDIANTTALENLTTLATIILPKWIYDKIFPLFSTNVILTDTSSVRADDYSAQTLYYTLFKGSDNKLTIKNAAGFTATANRHCRIQIDLLIDNE